MLCLELSPQPKVEPIDLSQQPPRDAVPSSLSPTAVGSSPSSPTERPILTSLRSDPESPVLQAVAVYDFNGDTTLGDLVFQTGEKIVDVRSLSAEWMSGRIGDRTGNFPMAFVQIS